MREHTLVSPLWVGCEKVDADDVNERVVTPQEVTSTGEVGVLSSSLTSVNRGQKLVRTGVRRINLEDRLERAARFTDAAQSVKCLP
jgi:hypothetical protein